MINFLKGQPSSDLLPIDLFKKATSLALDACNADIDVLQYGDALGTMEFRENLAKFLSKEYSMPVDSRHLCPTSGASFGLQHALSLLTRPNSVTKYCYFQEPTYFLAFDIFRDVGFQLDQFIGIPDNTRGLDIDHFEASLVKHLTPSSANNNNNKDIYDAVLYCVPTHANPTGSVLPTNQRQRLVELARKYNVLVICDDVYDMLTYSDEVPPKRLVAYDLDSVNPVVISNGSFSKILAPGARIGWLECHENLIERLGRCGSYISGGSPSNYMNQVVNQMLKSSNPDINLHHHVAKVRKTLDERLHKGMWEMIQQELVPLGCNALKPIGGYFIWLQLPSGIVCDDVQQVIRDHNIDISFGNTALFMVPNGDNEDDESYIRLCFAHYDTETLQAGIQRLAQAIRLSSTQSQDPNTWTLLPKGGKSSPNGTTSTTLNQQNPI